ncbi:hypothetical protein [Paenibacillus eucommiae]|uniref:Uncharacterized protein n=1 Tax=Paenibacillus eucommiae TaxID=1355755 RepID=A0ABS4IRM1_9BACL|nr:hypothetical protein [Paenibacillus eucommiae]MBP1990216.1 hypothetical protein [Paenibacillus eucommiae]
MQANHFRKEAMDPAVLETLSRYGLIKLIGSQQQLIHQLKEENQVLTKGTVKD